MTAIPAKAAGVGEVVVACPRPDAVVMAAALEAGVSRLFRVGGAHAVAALAYGTDTMPRVDKIVGPGNRFVAAAKALVAADCGIDFYAGPTEIVIVASKGPAAWIAADLIAQAEHDPDARAVLITPNAALATDVAVHVQARMPKDGPAQESMRLHGGAIVTKSLTEAIELANEAAAEHLVVDDERVAAKIRRAGSLFVGPWSAQVAGDYAIGCNHVLPTAGAARVRGGLSAADFVRQITVQRVTKKGLAAVGPERDHAGPGRGPGRPRRLDCGASAPDDRTRDQGPRTKDTSGGDKRETRIRTAKFDRRTKETDIRGSLAIDGQGRYDVRTGIRFFDHMLELFTRHGGFDLTLKAVGDLDVDQHHTVEDVGIVLGEAVLAALGDRKGINRAGYFVMPMDETLAVVAVDLGGRPHAKVDLKVKVRLVGDLQSELVADFFDGFAMGAKANVHAKVLYGRSSHHHVEAVFKAFARALRVACAKDARLAKMLPSTKGLL